MGAQAVAFAMGALEPDEELAVRSHLPRCPSCRESVRGTELVLGGLAASVHQIEPPTGLREEILGRAAQTLQTAPQAFPGPASAAATSEARPRTANRPGTGPPAKRPTASRAGRGSKHTPRRLLVTVMTAAAVLGVGNLVGYTTQLQQQHDTEVAQSHSLAELVTRFDGPGTTHATLRTSDGQVVAAVLATTTEHTVVIAGLRPNDADGPDGAGDTVYVVWGISTVDPVPIGSFVVSADGSDVHRLAPPAGVRSFLGYAISLERGGVVPTTPTTVVASGQAAT